MLNSDNEGSELRIERVSAEEVGRSLRGGLDRLTWIARETLGSTVGVLTLGGDGDCPLATGNMAGEMGLGDDPVAGLVLRRRCVLAVGAGEAPKEPQSDTPTLPSGYRSYLGAPIIRSSDGHAFGVIAVLDERPRGWGDRDRTLLANIADAAAAELTAIDLAAELETANEDLHGARADAENAASDFRLMAETVKQVFWVANAEGSDLIYVSPAAREVWGRPPSDLLAPNGRIATVFDEDQDRVAAAYAPDRLQRGDHDIEYRIVRPDGTLRWVRDRAYPVRNESGAIERIVGMAEDVTERRALEMQLRQSQKMEAIGRLAGGIAHDFNNLLTAITGHAQLLEGELSPGSELREHTQVIRMAADRSSRLTRQLLAFSRKQILQPRVVDLNEVVRSMEPMLRRMIGEDIDIRTGLKAGLSPIFADPGQIEQVLMNLVVNARDAMPGGGKLTISTSETELSQAYFNARQVDMPAGRYAMLGVADTGVGMDRSTEARIFEPFFTTKPSGKGTGLGLSTVYGIVKQTEGFVWVYSEPGLGTTFKVYLPLAKDTVEEAPRPSAEVETTPTGGTIMVVEDDASVRLLVKKVLERAGYEVIVADGAPLAASLGRSISDPIDLLLTDVVLPTLSGRAVADIVLGQHPESRLLFMSGYTDEAIVHHGVLDPGTEFLEKPFTPERLLGKVRELLGRRRD